VRVWDVAAGRQLGDPLIGHTGPVNAVAAGELNGRPVAVSVGDELTLHIRHLPAGDEIVIEIAASGLGIAVASEARIIVATAMGLVAFQFAPMQRREKS